MANTLSSTASCADVLQDHERKTQAARLSNWSLLLGLGSILFGFTFFVPLIGITCGLKAIKRDPSHSRAAFFGVALNAFMLAVGIALVAIFSIYLLPRWI
ncbi:hypothetical protein [Rathayibacter toxicus]|uniref:DUF4190 domain-containing protein n=1 Tax=Rathayibacter toxicus TaxID=145458 RepID=A0A2S5Y9X7_9MICO|nr:hypothetical protein [Rathayibacter toxicus]ALS57375.1 hypothetical protein APU90_05995 [Rathayibacter toxicus]PPG24747.1 hypothetical protein C5D15_00290 [Rathayibacter toxicus]PPG48201.1 hypothetical protein C5D16_00300 [Rathayibacter toxicus]PPH25503.1 hypothetical protein C5D17_00290 [Rathayibacter toxicus]PPH59205.1 hypothetical protein C5D30_00290 [Rathayibacter toxicus]